VEKFRNNGSTKTENKTTINYLNLIKANLGLILTISLIFLGATLIYAILSPDIYRTQTVLKISEPQGKNVLQDPLGTAFGSSSTDRYIANEIAVMTNRTIREEVARLNSL